MTQKNWLVIAVSLFGIWFLSLSQVWATPGVPITGFVMVFGQVNLDHWLIGPAAISGRIITFLVFGAIAYSLYRANKAK